MGIHKLNGLRSCLIASAAITFNASACLITPVNPNTPASASEMNANVTALLDHITDLEARAEAANLRISTLNSDIGALAERQALILETLGSNNGRLEALETASISTEALVGKTYCLEGVGDLSIVNASNDYSVMNVSASSVYFTFVSETEAKFAIWNYGEFEFGTYYSPTDQLILSTDPENIPSEIPLTEVITTSYTIGEKNLITFPEADFEARFTGDGNFLNGVKSVAPFVNENGDTQAEGAQSIGFVCNVPFFDPA